MDVHTLANATSGDNAARFTNNNFSYIYGNDSLNSGAGNDDLYGDVNTITTNLTAQGGAGVFTAPINSNSFIHNFGADQLLAGDGNDNLYGDANTIQLTTSAQGVLLPLAGSITANILSYLFNNDNLEGGKGNDWLYGDAKEIDLSLANTGPVGFNTDIGVINVHFGSDTLNGGDGNDNIVADILTFNVAKTINGSPVNFDELDLEYGNDTMSGGAGKDKFHFLISDLDNDANFDGLGHKAITDLEKQDTLVFHGVNNLATLDTNVTAVQEVGNDVLITFNDDGAHTTDALPSTLELENIANQGNFTDLASLAAVYHFDFI